MKSNDLIFWRKIIIIVSLVLFAQIIAPFTKPGLTLGHDSQLNLTYTQSFLNALQQGQFPVRYIDWFKPGNNAPLFNFYQPGIYYLFTAPMLLGIPKVLALKIVIVTMWFLSSLLMYLFTKRHFGTLPALIAAYFYLIAPYHILDVFIRAALSEFIALSFVPGIFWALKGYFDETKGIFLTLLAMFIAATTIMHPPTILMFSPLILAYLLYLYMSTKSKASATATIIAMIVGFGIVSFFLIPALLEQKFVQTIFMRSGYYDFHNHFVCIPQLFSTFWGHGTSQTGCLDGMSFQVGLAHWFCVGTVILIIIIKLTTKLKKEQFSNFLTISNFPQTLLLIFLTAFFTSLLMTHESTKLIWEFVPYLEYIQYPWRFLSVAIFTSSFIAATLLIIFKNESHQLVVFVILIAAATLAYSNFAKPIAYATEAEINFGGEILHDSVSGIKLLTPEPGYMPKWTQALPPDDNNPKEEIQIATQSAKLLSSNLKAHKKEYEIEVHSPSTARLYTHYFPGWEVTVNDTPQKALIQNIFGYIDLELPAGNQKVTLTFKNTPIRSFSNLLSVSFLIVALLMAVAFNRKNPHSKVPNDT